MVWEGLVSDWELDMKKESCVGRGGRGWELITYFGPRSSWGGRAGLGMYV